MFTDVPQSHFEGRIRFQEFGDFVAGSTRPLRTGLQFRREDKSSNTIFCRYTVSALGSRSALLNVGKHYF